MPYTTLHRWRRRLKGKKEEESGGWGNSCVFSPYHVVTVGKSAVLFVWSTLWTAAGDPVATAVLSPPSSYGRWCYCQSRCIIFIVLGVAETIITTTATTFLSFQTLIIAYKHSSKNPSCSLNLTLTETKTISLLNYYSRMSGKDKATGTYSKQVF